MHSFKYSAARREDFREVQIKMDLDLTNFLQHTVVRWLSIGPAVKRILEQWEAVTQFVNDLAKDPKKLPRSKFQESSHDAQCQGKDGYKDLTGVFE